MLTLLLVLLIQFGFAQESDADQETGTVISAGTESTEAFVDVMRDMLGDRVAERIEAEFESLDQDDKERLAEKLANKQFSGVNIRTDGIGGAEMTIAILAITLTLGMPIIVLLLILYFSYRKRRQRVDLIQSFVEAGKDVPPQLLGEEEGTDPLRSGINLTAIGLALVVALYWLGEEAAVIGLIPLAIGVSRLGYYYLSEKKGSGA